LRRLWPWGALLLVAAAWVLGTIWTLMTHRFEGPTILALTRRHGIHLTDPLGVIVPAAFTVLVGRTWQSDEPRE
jgi:hypothetical protein